jgi:hypothetical protein
MGAGREIDPTDPTGRSSGRDHRPFKGLARGDRNITFPVDKLRASCAKCGPRRRQVTDWLADASEIVCPYCSTLFRFDPSLGANEADPADCAYGDMD